MLKLLIGAAIGAAAVWFLDPHHGTSRREQAITHARKGQEQATKATQTIKAKTSSSSDNGEAAPADQGSQQTAPSGV
jgi:gas vesicle protein